MHKPAPSQPKTHSPSPQAHPQSLDCSTNKDSPTMASGLTVFRMEKANYSILMAHIM